MAAGVDAERHWQAASRRRCGATVGICGLKAFEDRVVVLDFGDLFRAVSRLRNRLHPQPPVRARRIRADGPRHCLECDKLCSTGKITGRRIRIRQCDDASASCSGSSQLDPPSVSLASTVRFTTRSTFNVTSPLDRHCGSSEPKLLRSGKMPSPRRDPAQSWLSMHAQ